MAGQSPTRTTARWIAFAFILPGLFAVGSFGLGAIGHPATGPLSDRASVPPVSAEALTAVPDAGHASNRTPGPPTPTRPQEISSGNGWPGTDYRQSCAGCVPPDPEIATGLGYLVELTNGSDRVFLTNGTAVFNETLDALFGAGKDLLVSPQVQFDPSSLRFFVSADDLSAHEILAGASATSDPTGGWYVESWSPGAGLTAGTSWLAVDRTDVVLSVDEYSVTGTLVGGQVWAANKTDLTNGGGAEFESTGAPSLGLANLVPADPLSVSPSLYLVRDAFGAPGNLSLYVLNGSAPANLLLSGPTNFSTDLTAPPNATEAGTTDLIGTGEGAISSAAWRSGILWAVATGGCTPSGDIALRSCLHLWQIATARPALEQDFLWSTGVGTYDFDPAVSMTERGDLAVVFGESSAALDPSIVVSGQAINDPLLTLETPLAIHNGSGPIAPATGCAGGVCPFGGDFSITYNSLTACRFYTAGEFAGRNYSTDDWKTWINPVAVLPTFPVTFGESELPAGTDWSVTVNGQVVSSDNASLELYEPNGSYTFLAASPIAGGDGTRYLPEPASGSFLVNATPVDITLTYLREYELSVAASPTGAGSVFPGGGWYFANTSVSLSALGAAGYLFNSWSGTGAGSYTGGDNPANVTIVAPLNETAVFWTAATYLVTFTESGLPGGANWTATVDGVANGSIGASIGFNEPNGSYSYSVATPVPGAPRTEYAADPNAGSFAVAGSGANFGIAYDPDYELTAAPTSLSLGTVNPSGGWYPIGTSLNLSALGSPGEVFLAWNGTGNGSYTGDGNPAWIVMGGPIVEVAEFTPAVTFAVTYNESGLPEGAVWSVTTNGVYFSTTSPSITFNEPNGSYSYVVGSSYTDPNGTGWAGLPQFGSFVVAGSAIPMAVEFHSVPPSSANGGKGGGPSVGTGIPDWLLGIALAALVVLSLALMVTLWRRESSAGPPVPFNPPPPPAVWDESG